MNQATAKANIIVSRKKTPLLESLAGADGGSVAAAASVSALLGTATDDGRSEVNGVLAGALDDAGEAIGDEGRRCTTAGRDLSPELRLVSGVSELKFDSDVGSMCLDHFDEYLPIITALCGGWLRQIFEKMVNHCCRLKNRRF